MNDKYIKGEVVEISFDGIVLSDQITESVHIQFKRKDGFYYDMYVPAEFIMLKTNEYEAQAMREGRI